MVAILGRLEVEPGFNRGADVGVWIADDLESAIVRRQGLEDGYTDDLKALGTMTGVLSKIVPGFSGMNPREMLSELGSAVRGQMSFRQEIENNRRFAKDFEHHDWLRLPEIYDEYCSDDVITMEFVVGDKALDYVVKRGTHDPELAKNVYSMYFEMAFLNKFFHADLHSGNLLIEGEGKAVLLDTGLANEFPNHYVKRQLRAYLCVAAVDGWLQSDNYLGDRPWMADEKTREAFGHDMHMMYQRWDKNRAAGHTKDLTTLWLQIMMILRKHRVPLDRELVMLMVGDITISGLVHEIDPEFDVVEYTRQELPRMIFRDGKLPLNDPYLLAASRRDLLREIRRTLGVDVNDDEYV